VTWGSNTLAVPGTGIQYRLSKTERTSSFRPEYSKVKRAKPIENENTEENTDWQLEKL
jgi:hypothetical protein